jgi:hypothetical protein
MKSGPQGYFLPQMITTILLISLALTGVIAQSQNQPKKPSPARLGAKEIAQKVIPSMVLVNVECRDGSTVSYGSGFFVGVGLVATNRHVVDCGTKAEIKLVGQDKLYPVIALWLPPDESLDLALLKVEGVSRPSLALSPGRTVSIAEKVYAAGNPKGLEGTFSDGIVSGIRQSDRLIQHTAPISFGSSGGPLLDEFGKVIGINTLLIREGQNLNFAIPVVYLKTFLGQVNTRKILAAKQPRSTTRPVAAPKRLPPETKEAPPPKPAPANTAPTISSGEALIIAQSTLETLRKLRDEWKEADPELLRDGWLSIGDAKKDRYAYARLLREAKDDVSLALKHLPDNELKEAIRLAMETYLDLENIYQLFSYQEVFGKSVNSSAISPYVEKYSLPSENNNIRTDTVFAIFLPLGRDRINRIISILGGPPELAPVDESSFELKSFSSAMRSKKAEDFEAYLKKYPDGKYADLAMARTNEGIKVDRELKAITRTIFEAVMKGQKATLDPLIDDQFIGYGKGKAYTKKMMLSQVKVEPRIKSYRILSMSVDFKQGKPVLTYVAIYESRDHEVVSYSNELKFSKQQGQWKVIEWNFRIQ